MCGITGWIDWAKDISDQQPVLEKMTQRLAKRGPDAAGFWLSSRAALGHRRLIVVDPEGGQQPMTRQFGTQSCTITYNGELYNTLELRQELISRGHVFLTRNSDTEALLLAYQEWGPACVDRFNGIFAFAIWDEANEQLFLARDRLGVKPLFYAQRGSQFIFGSELKALLSHPAVEPVVGAEGLAEIFCIGPARTPGHGVFRGINELRPGYSLICSRQGVQKKQYWSLVSRPHEDDLPGTAATVRQLLQDAVSRQLVSDVPLCTFLSGGLDSSAITAIAVQTYQETGRGKLPTYSVDYLENDRYFKPNQFQPDADAAWVPKVSSQLGTDHHYVFIGQAELAAALVEALSANDLPGMADIDSSLYLFCQQVKRDVTVALSGESADEIFGGYPWFYREEAINSGTFPWNRLPRERARLLSPALREMIRPEEYVADQYQTAINEVPRLLGENEADARMRELFYLNLTRFMPTLLDRKDRMSMGVGLEVRVPFCDHRLVEYVWNIPWSMKNHNQREKGLLRLALTGVLPDEVRLRRKSPYPKTHHPAYLQIVRDWLISILDNPDSPLLELIDASFVRSIVLSDGAGFSSTWFSQLMGLAQLFAYLIQVDCWLREYQIRIG